MTDYLKILRLNYLDYSQRRIADSARCSRHTIRKALEATCKANIHWPLDEDLTNAELERLLFPIRSGTRTASGNLCYTYRSQKIKCSLWHLNCQNIPL